MIPNIGDKITCELARELCGQFDIQYLVRRIENDPDVFEDWIFDGASMIPDELFARIFDIPSLTEIALRHDLKYAYGDPDNSAEKAEADRVFKQELLNDGASPILAQLMYRAVDAFGDGPIATDFTWGFARR